MLIFCYVYVFFNAETESSKFLYSLKLANIALFFKKVVRTRKKIPHQIAYYQYSLKYIKYLLTDLSKTFGCLRHDLLVTILHSCVIFLSLLKLLTNSLAICKQQTKVETSYSSWIAIEHGTPKGLS